MSRIANWQVFIDRFKARLSGWKANLLSIGGRLTLIQIGGADDSKKVAWVKWLNILAFMDKGGLGLAIHGDEADNNKDCLIQHRIANASWAWDWSRPVNAGRTTAEFDALILDIASIEPDDLGVSDSCIWSLSHDNSFSVNSVRKHIDELTLRSRLWPLTWDVKHVLCLSLISVCPLVRI
ncbi:hypothetical protein Tco_0257830 [Tanacetum coccineum]